MITLAPDVDGVAARCAAVVGTEHEATFSSGRINAFTMLAIVDEGAGWAEAGERRFALAPGDAMLVPPGLIRHGYVGERRVRIVAVAAPLALAGDARAVQLRWNAAADAALGALHRSLAQPPSARRRAAVTAACDALRAVLRDAACVARAARPMRGAVLVDAYGAFAGDIPPPSCSEVARRCGYRLSSLSVLSARESGRGLRVWREIALMQQARHAIESGAPVQTVAARMGYDPAAFARAFGRVHGTPPSRWRSGAEHETPVLSFDALRARLA
ncbi:hypothetical protein WPS_26740 [Vulcanimicrobium alpinum]|uniref:HTH araC/xylS-type domain-containing protein n=2 Tax=Vulcanimicrobium alpinum TaxID=3016050 RepID=A0AAN1XXW2_UNVUL|nr:hypothetical protein WPS_26740 [Vulcanimicrobium alpinum]